MVGERDQRWLLGWVMERKAKREKKRERERECERYRVERERENVKFYQNFKCKKFCTNLPRLIWLTENIYL